MRVPIMTHKIIPLWDIGLESIDRDHIGLNVTSIFILLKVVQCPV